MRAIAAARRPSRLSTRRSCAGSARRASLGASIVVTGLDRKTETRQIVGIIRDTRSNGGDTRARPELYVPFAQTPFPSMNLIVRSANPSDPRLATDIRRAVAAIDSTLVADRITPLAELLDTRVATWRFGAWLLGVFAAMALLLAAVGLAAAMAWWVTQRTREIGVRMALGANAGDVSRMVVRQAAGLAAAGIVLGLAGAAASTRLIASWLYGVTPLDVPTFAWSAAGMLAVAMVASYIPVRRAARVDPLVALRGRNEKGKRQKAEGKGSPARWPGHPSLSPNWLSGLAVSCQTPNQMGVRTV